MHRVLVIAWRLLADPAGFVSALHLSGLAGDKGLVATSKAAHHGISALFDAPFDPEKEGGLVYQYEVKLQNGTSTWPS